MTNPYRDLPSVNKILNHPNITEIKGRFPHGRVTDHCRSVLQIARDTIRNKAKDPNQQKNSKTPSVESLATAVIKQLEDSFHPSLIPVINATGIILHTNLGRAPLSNAAIEAMSNVGAGYSNLEISLEQGTRRSRLAHMQNILHESIGAEAGIVVNNNASALMLVLSALAGDREVIISRGQAVEIGDGFRIPDICRLSGAKLVEVGTTNRTRAIDYSEAITQNTAAIMRVHTSNFRVLGFTEEATLDELHDIAQNAGVLLLDDIGSGCLLDTTAYGLASEPRPQDSLDHGVDLTMFSGDKLLGGPQAGIIAGRADLIDIISRHSLSRTFRTDKSTLGALMATLGHYIAGDAEKEIPIWKMISANPEDILSRAKKWHSIIGRGSIQSTTSMIGGGSLPGETLPTYALSLSSPETDINRVAKHLRLGTPAVAARVADGALLLDPRTVREEEEELLLDALKKALHLALGCEAISGQ